ncbi:MAG: PEP-CTERM sorting domain-containing protein, partial [Pirellulales bacterium]|nr:PEP-CTERM sorting domain-containing protein [Pirellulales bacterium]
SAATPRNRNPDRPARYEYFHACRKDTVGPRDAAILAANWGYDGSSEARAVPEPAMVIMILLGTVGFLAHVRCPNRID